MASLDIKKRAIEDHNASDDEANSAKRSKTAAEDDASSEAMKHFIENQKLLSSQSIPTTLTPEDIFHQCVCQALVSLNNKDYPILVSTFYAQHVKPTKGGDIDLKTTSFKKFSNYIKYFYVNNIKFEEGKYLEILTDDDELSLAWYLIEEEYARRNSKRFLYLIQEDWKLPLKFSAKKSRKHFTDDL